MDFLIEKQIVMYTSKKYEDIYTYFNKNYDLKYHQLFLICAAIGSKMGTSTPLAERSREFRSNYYTLNERNLIYAMILNDEAKGKDLERFKDDDFHLEARKMIENYAEGGMDLLVENVFQEKWNGYKLDDTYKNYMIDLMIYILTTLKEVPF
ncbi:hypothetical protein [Kurthia massiliensis]|uniref:hypothetical protein n=1 Tax=Kurthia massiliensis TaxID=1033739 RepID=UPI000287FB7E|nr:hypothetical protein [Kurthia massiliensis]